jgi:hypothetical protein
VAVSLQATALPVAVIAAGIWIAYSAGGMAGIVATTDSYGPITDNASGIAEMADLPHLPHGVRPLLAEPFNGVCCGPRAYEPRPALLACSAYKVGDAFLGSVVGSVAYGAQVGIRGILVWPRRAEPQASGIERPQLHAQIRHFLKQDAPQLQPKRATRG